MAIIIDGVLKQTLPWGLVVTGILIALVLELAGIPSLPFAVGMYLSIHQSVPIFLGGLARWLADKLTRSQAADSDAGPGVLLASGYIAGGTIAGLLGLLLVFTPEKFQLIHYLDLGRHFPESIQVANWPAVSAFSVLLVFLLLVGWGKLLGPVAAAPPRTPE